MIKNKFRYALFIFLLIVINIPSVMAVEKDEGFQICGNNGYLYYVKPDVKIVGKDKRALFLGSMYDRGGETTFHFNDPDINSSIMKGYNGTGSIKMNNKDIYFKYAFSGNYAGPTSPETTKCFKKYEEQGNSGKVTPMACGENRLISGTDIKISTSAAKSGLINVTLEANGDNDIWQSIYVTSISYAGTKTNYNPPSKENNNISMNNTKIIISGIEPSTIASNAIFTVRLAVKKSKKTCNDETDCMTKCNDYMYLGEWSTTIPKASEVEIPNPMINSNICKEVYNYNKASNDLRTNYIYECYNKYIKYSEKDTKTLEQTVKSKFGVLKNIYEGLNIEKGGLADVAKSEKGLICTNPDFGLPVDDDSTTVPFERKVTYEYNGTYWGMVCIQEYYIQSDVPQLVKGGMGVHYNNRVQINKTCHIYNKKQVVKKPECTLQMHSPICTHPGGITWDDQSTGGPTEDFDNCVNTCDGGKYSQSCINQCYNQVYSSDRKLLKAGSGKENVFTNRISKLKTLEPKNNCQFNSYSGSNECGQFGDKKVEVKCDPDKYCERNHKNGTCSVMVDGAEVQTVCYSGWCDTQGTSCEVSWSVEPEGCSWNPKTEYDTEIGVSKAEFENLDRLRQEYSNIEKYTIKIKDSEDKINYEVSGTTSTQQNMSDPQLIITKDDEKSKIKDSNKEKIQIGTDDSYEIAPTTTVTTVYDVKLPMQYSLKNDANTILVKGVKSNKYYEIKFENKNSPYQFIAKKDVNEALLSKGEHVYYTKLDSHETNLSTYTEKNETSCGKSIETLVKESTSESSSGGYYLFTEYDYIFYKINGKEILKVLSGRDKNINVSFKIGTIDGQNVNLTGKIVKHDFDQSKYQCYYGVYNALRIHKDEKIIETNNTIICDPEEEGSGGSEISSGGGNGGGQIPDPTPTPTSGSSSEGSGLRYYYREIYLEPEKNGYGGVFPNGREPRWNWTGTIKNGQVTGAANNEDSSYIIDPEKLIEDIESKGDTIFDEESEYDYVFTMTPEIITQIRQYNKTTKNNKKITYLDFSLVGSTADKKNYSEKIKEWYPNLSTMNITDCNNAKGGTCYPRGDK